MKKFSVKKLALAGMFCALCVVGSVFSFPMFGSKCAPVQHMVNVLCAVLLGPWWGVGVAFVASLLRNILGLGSLMAFPGSMFGALLCGLVYAKTKNLIATLVGEVFGTSILGGLCAYPVAICLMGKSAGDIAFYAYIVPSSSPPLWVRSLRACWCTACSTPVPALHAEQPFLTGVRHVCRAVCQCPHQKPPRS